MRGVLRSPIEVDEAGSSIYGLTTDDYPQDDYQSRQQAMMWSTVPFSFGLAR